MKKIIIFLLLSVTSCATPPETLLPVHVEQTQASFDGNSQNSGLIGYVDGKGFELTQNAVNRYLKLAEKFQEEPVAILKEDGKLFLTKEGMVHFLELTDKNLQK